MQGVVTGQDVILNQTDPVHSRQDFLIAFPQPACCAFYAKRGECQVYFGRGQFNQSFHRLLYQEASAARSMPKIFREEGKCKITENLWNNHPNHAFCLRCVPSSMMALSAETNLVWWFCFLYGVVSEAGACLVAGWFVCKPGFAGCGSVYIPFGPKFGLGWEDCTVESRRFCQAWMFWRSTRCCPVPGERKRRSEAPRKARIFRLIVCIF